MNLQTEHQSAYDPQCQSKHNTTKQVFVSFNISMNYLPITKQCVMYGSEQEAELLLTNCKSTRSCPKNQVSNLPVQGSQKPTIISDLCFHIKLPNGISNHQKINYLQITQQNTASNSATISATKLKFFLIFFVFSEEFSVKTKHFYSNPVSDDLEEKPHYNAL